MKSRSIPTTRRRGAIVPLTAAMTIPLLAMVAFSVDMGYLVAVETELQNSADASALAGTQQLMGPYVQWSLPTLTGAQRNTIRNNAITAARQAAKNYATYNQAGGVTLTLLDGDIEVGYTDAQGNYTASPPTSTFPNTVAVTARRDSSANQPVKLFFAPVIGASSMPLSAYARAAMMEGDVTTLQALPNTDAHILPVALDVNIWNQFLKDGKTQWDGTVHLNANNGYPELQVYPDKWTTGNNPGSFGLLDVGPPANNVPAFRNWIDTGETPNDISYLLNNSLLPVSPSAGKQWKCGPGLKSTLTADFSGDVGKPNLIPLFQPVVPYNPLLPGLYQAQTGNGQGATYNVVGFVGVSVSSASGSGSSMVISIQPMANVDPTGVITVSKPAGSGTSVLGSLGGILGIGVTTPQTTFTSPKLVK